MTEWDDFLSSDPCCCIVICCDPCGTASSNGVGSTGGSGMHLSSIIDAEPILRDGRECFYNPLRHADPSPDGWDFKCMPCFCMYELSDGTIMTDSEFGNYIAGYMGGYHYGYCGYLSMRCAGNLYETGYNPFSGDCEDSISDINRGYEDGIIQKNEDIKRCCEAIGDCLDSIFPNYVPQDYNDRAEAIKSCGGVHYWPGSGL